MLTLILTLLAVIIILVVIWHHTRLRGNTEPIIELEKLVNCTKCDSLIPEGVRKCAFCGASQNAE